MKSEFEEFEELKHNIFTSIFIVLTVITSIMLILIMAAMVYSKYFYEEEPKLHATGCVAFPWYGELVRMDDGLYYDDVTGIVYFWDGKSPRHEATPCYSGSGLPYRKNLEYGGISPTMTVYDIEDVVKEVVKEVIVEEKALQKDAKETEVVQETEVIQENE